MSFLFQNIKSIFERKYFSPIDVPRLPNIDPFSGSFLKAASTEDEIAKINKTTNVIDKTVLMDNIFMSFFHFVLRCLKDETDDDELIATC